MNFNYLAQLDKDISRLRGVVLSGTIEVERLIDDFIALYFCESNSVKVGELKSLLFWTDRVGLDYKRQIFAYLVTNHYDEFLKLNPQLLKKLEKLIPNRNILAHAEIKTKADDYKDEIVFIRWANGKKTEKIFKEADLISIQKDIFYICYRIISLTQVLINQQRPL